MGLSAKILFGISLLLGSSLWAVGFSSGNQFQSMAIVGPLTVRCIVNGNPHIATFNCRGEVLEPTNYDFFMGPQGVDADQIQLMAKHEDGSTRNKTIKYDSQKGQSTEAFNLWVYSLLQRPLLADGKNAIHYQLTKKGQLVTEGDVTVNVKRVPQATCPHGSYDSVLPQDCDNEFTNCQRYFRDYNYCH